MLRLWQSEQQPGPRTWQPVASDGPGEAGTQGGRWLLWIVNIEPKESMAKAGRETGTGNIPFSVVPRCISELRSREDTALHLLSLTTFPSDLPQSPARAPISNSGTAQCSNQHSHSLLEGSWGRLLDTWETSAQVPAPQATTARSASLPSLHTGKSCLPSLV